jgi:hypothetical protein
MLDKPKVVLDQELLKIAKDAGSTLREAERQSQLARAEYHTLIRRLHLAGGSLREIADTLDMSYQRVQQIVKAAGGSWWSRIWRTRRVKRDAVCTFCERPPSEVSKLIAGPNVYICSGCVGDAEQALAGRNLNGSSSRISADRQARARCSFCGKTAAKDRRIAASHEARICRDCLGLCREILNDRRTGP